MHSIQKLSKVKSFFFFHFWQWHEKNKNGPHGLLTLEENLLFLPSSEYETTKSGKEETGL